MIDRGTFGSVKNYKVLEYIYEYFDKTDIRTQKAITKTFVRLNGTIASLKTIENNSFRALTSKKYKNDFILNIKIDFRDKPDLRDRLLNIAHAKFADLIKDASASALKEKRDNIQKQKQLNRRKKFTPVYINDLHEYDYLFEDRTHYLYYSKSDQWSPSAKGTLAFQLKDTGNYYLLPQETQTLDYAQMKYIQIILEQEKKNR